MFTNYPDVISVSELQSMLHIGRNTAYELVRSGKIYSIKIGRTYRIPRSAVEDYLGTSCQIENNGRRNQHEY